MNNNLVPVQRLDKNGRLNTKHVRADKTQAATAKVPAPALAPAKTKLPAAQTRQKPRTVAYSAPGNYELNQLLGTDPQATELTITASDAEFYSVLSTTSKANAFALLQAGIRSADEASNYLEDNGLAELIEDNSELCEEALDRKIPPNKFIESSANLRGPEGSDYYLDALEVYSSSIPKGTGSHSNLVITNQVYEGEIKLADLKEIGFKKFNTFREKDALVDALIKIGAGKSNLTITDVSALVDKHPYYFRAALELSSKYGTERVLQLNTPVLDYSDHLEERGVDKDRTISLIKYRDQVSQLEYEKSIYRTPIHYELLEKCFDAGLSPLQVATDDYTEQQLDGLLNGATPGVSSGWL